MKKRVLIVLLIIFGLFIITGCNKNIEDNNLDKPTKEETISNLKIGNVPVELDMSGSFNKISYKFPSKASSSNVGTYAIIDLMDSSDLLVRVAMSIYTGKTIGDVMKGSNLSSVDAIEFNNNIWNLYEGIQEDGKKILNYVTQESGDSYSITFISDKNINDFVNEFMNNVVFSN